MNQQSIQRLFVGSETSKCYSNHHSKLAIGENNFNPLISIISCPSIPISSWYHILSIQNQDPLSVAKPWVHLLIKVELLTKQNRWKLKGDEKRISYAIGVWYTELKSRKGIMDCTCILYPDSNEILEYLLHSTLFASLENFSYISFALVWLCQRRTGSKWYLWVI